MYTGQLTAVNHRGTNIALIDFPPLVSMVDRKHILSLPHTHLPLLPSSPVIAYAVSGF